MITFPDIRYYYQQTVTSFAVQKSIEMVTTVAFLSFHTIKQAALVPATLTSIAIALPIALINLSLFGVASTIDLISKKIGHRESLHTNPSGTLERIVFIIDTIGKYIVPKIVFFLTIAALSPHIVMAKSMDFIEHKGLQITQIALDTLGIPVELPISRKKMLSILDEWKQLGLPDENRKKAYKQIVEFYDYSNSLFDNFFFSARSLSLEGCRLRSLPDIFMYKPFSQLDTLSLKRNRLDFLPASLYGLPRTCELSISENQFSEDEIYEITNIIHSSDYQGPIITGISNLTVGSQTIYWFYRDLCRTVGRTPQSLSNLRRSEALRSWLSRLSRVSDYSKSNETTKKAFITHIITYLEEADRNPEFQTIFNNIIQDASATCGDRIALSVLHIDIAYQLANIDSSNMRKLAKFLLRGCLAIDLLEECARQKIESQQGKVDQIEIFLAYPIFLKKELQLPINQETMLYFHSSSVTSNNLDAARDFVLSSLENQDTCLTFLIQHDAWIKALEKNNEKAFKVIKSKRDLAQKNAMSEEQESKIQQEYMEALKRLSIQAIEREDISLP